jgi:acetylornithine deacetylase/succinyl-diaminopimelate desuccinylase-like protein
VVGALVVAERRAHLTVSTAADHVDRVWEADVLPTLQEYIRIPNVSPAFDPDWATTGHMDRAVELVRAWMDARPVDGLLVTVERLPGRTPLIIAEVPATDPEATGTVLLYGHVDKQPEMVGWREGFGPWLPVIEGERLFGRGAGDDGYAAFAAMSAIEALQATGGRHARCVVVIEASEESASTDLEDYIEAFADRIGQPDLVVCLDSGCGDYERLWLTTSLRGLVAVDVTVRVLREGVHSGAAGGVVPSTFRMLRGLLDRIEDVSTGELRIPELQVEVPADRAGELAATATELGEHVAGEFPFAAGSQPIADGDPVAQLRAKTWEPALELIAIEGVPDRPRGGNVLRPFTTARLSFRLPPTCDPDNAGAAIVRALTADPPYGAQVDAEVVQGASGWNAPTTAPWLATALDEASVESFGEPYRTIGEGGTIPFMAMLGARFPEAQFVVTGAMGPGSNGHGPNEFLDLPMARGVTTSVAHVLDAHARHT